MCYIINRNIKKKNSEIKLSEILINLFKFIIKKAKFLRYCKL